MRFFLSGYTIRVFKRDKEKGKCVLKLDKLPNGYDFYDIFNNFLNSLSSNAVINDYEKNILQATSIDTDKNQRLITGTIDSGVYGINSKLIDINTRKTSYIRNEYDAETLPFYFMVTLPKGRDEGILLLESIGRYEMKRSLVKTFGDYMTKKHPDLSFEICKLIPGGMIEKLLSQSRTTKIRLIKYDISDDIAETLEDPHQERDFEIKREVIYSSKDLGIQNKIRKIINKEKAISELFEIREIKENDYDKLKFELKIGTTTKTIDLDNLFDINNSIDITDDLTINTVTGHPYVDSLKSTFWFHLEYFDSEMNKKI